MEILKQIWLEVSPNISWAYLVTFMLLSYAIKKYFTEALTKLFGVKFRMVYVVFILAAIIAIPFLWFNGETFRHILITYSIGTSLHELIFEAIEKRLKGILFPEK